MQYSQIVNKALFGERQAAWVLHAVNEHHNSVSESKVRLTVPSQTLRWRVPLDGLISHIFINCKSGPQAEQK